LTSLKYRASFGTTLKKMQTKKLKSERPTGWHHAKWLRKMLAREAPDTDLSLLVLASD